MSNENTVDSNNGSKVRKYSNESAKLKNNENQNIFKENKDINSECINNLASEKNTFDINNENNSNINKPNIVILKNVGNTTYMSSVIRCLTDNSDFYDYYLKNKDIIKNNADKMPISYAFSRIIAHLYPSINGPFENSYSLDKFYKVIIFLNPAFKGKSTKNAIDFLIYFIEKIHQEGKQMQKLLKNIDNSKQIEIDYNNYDKYFKYLREFEYSNILDEFYWINQSVNKCWNCNEEKKTFNSFFTYDLDFENALGKTILEHKKELTIFDCIKYTLKSKTLYNVFCENCDEMSNIEKNSSIKLCEKSLIFLVRRNEETKNINNLKNNEIIFRIDEKLDLSDLIGIEKSVYTLKGLISYNIEELEYTAYSVNPNNKQWYKYNKEKIIPIKIYDFINGNSSKILPEILFYRKLLK